MQEQYRPEEIESKVQQLLPVDASLSFWPTTHGPRA